MNRQIQQRHDRARQGADDEEAHERVRAGLEKAESRGPVGKSLECGAPQERPHDESQKEWSDHRERPPLAVEDRAQVVERRGEADDRRRKGGDESLGVLAVFEPPFRIDLAGVARNRLLVRQRRLHFVPDHHGEWRRDQQHRHDRRGDDERGRQHAHQPADKCFDHHVKSPRCRRASHPAARTSS